VLQAHGFRILHAERMPLIDQVEAFRRASFVIGPHGAGLMNLIFAPPGTRVLELFEPSEVRRCYWAHCRELGHNYHFQLGTPGPMRGSEPEIVVDSQALSGFIRDNWVKYFQVRLE
jgi:capsular polysaccharide biosynthesis protein